MKRLFWDERLRRIAALWRILLHLVMIVILFVITSSAAFAIYAAIVSVIGADSTSVMVPNAPSGQEALAAMMDGNPAFLLATVLLQGAVVMISIWLAARFLDRRKFVDFGLRINRRWWQDLGFGLALGAGLMLLIFLVEYAAGWITVTGSFDSGYDNLSFGTAFIGALTVFLAVGIYEEVLSRGYHLKNLAEGLRFIGPRIAILLALLLSSAVFGVLHAGNPNATFISTFNIFLAGIFLGLGAVLTGELAIPIGLHITWNFFQGNVFGFPVSGNVAGPSIIRIEQGGNPLITGGAFGPEAGLIGIGAMVLGMVLTWLWVRRQGKPTGLHLALTEPELLEQHQRVVEAFHLEEKKVAL